jgi:hypothetical protein
LSFRSELAAVAFVIAAGCADGRVGLFYVGPRKDDPTAIAAQLIKQNRVPAPRIVTSDDDESDVATVGASSSAIASLAFPKVSASYPALEVPVRLYVGTADGRVFVWNFML